MRDCSRICRYLHIPAQSGSDRILRLMNRGYTAGQYLELIDRARGLMPDICLASDFIVGFPTETDDEFQQTVALAEHCRFKNSFIFKYSPRPGTHASERYPDDVPEEVKRKRNNELLAIQGRICAQNNAALVGQTVEIIVEGVGSLAAPPAPPAAAGNVELGWQKRQAAAQAPTHKQLIGRTRGDQIVAFNGDPALIGKMANAKIIDARQMTLFGQLCSE
jgi:tRNA-2-methylthio-N6-dimethylallyladenosine synthase